MMIHKITLQYITFRGLNDCALNLMNINNQNSIIALKLLSQLISKRYYKTLGSSVINGPMVLQSLVKIVIGHLNKDDNIQN